MKMEWKGQSKPDGRIQKIQQQVVIPDTANRCLDYTRESSMHKRAGMDKRPEMLEGNSSRYGKGECWQRKLMLTKLAKGKQD